ncbi:MAG TPA: rhodanese-like domain-containing protein [Planktothrix sp.]|jgi:rhodanese-related sulfurtransferase
MAVDTLSKQAAEAVKFFEAKLAFEIGPVELQYALKANEPLQILDLRTPELFAKGHVPGAINVNYDDLQKDVSKLDTNKTQVVYCYNLTCHLAAKAALLLAQKGLKVRELVGGYDTYAETQGAKIEGSSCSSADKGHSCA